MYDNIITAATGIVGSGASVFGLGWWLSGKFRAVEEAARNQLSSHEARDQERHEENLERFSKISVALAGRGHKNGSA
jgi:hypothetical protein